ncbi:hypothetical protein HPB50_011990 [Hyalomma asiaticum]|uniref:Uncharacterized protein n=1 Tax=Hyalomma asiaticum TaxID=266040 RepID=A0ACB7TJ76_HYAAI|nr:hypothetical protein HPB50_011990 [Hyalomma asiaticum]
MGRGFHVDSSGLSSRTKADSFESLLASARFVTGVASVTAGIRSSSPGWLRRPYRANEMLAKHLPRLFLSCWGSSGDLHNYGCEPSGAMKHSAQ